MLVAVGRDPMYRALVPRAFAANGGAGNVQAGDTRDRSVLSIEQIVQAIAAFERTMVSVQSPYDRYRYGNQPDAISESAKRGETFFFSGQRGGCFQCHGGWNFNGALRIETDTQAIGSFFNTGLYNVAGAFSYPRTNTGIHAITQLSDDVGRFRVPTLRNIAVTAPYMHDGSIATLAEVLDHYAAGGRTIASGPNAGVGQRNPNKSARVHGFSMTGAEKRDLLAFLESLTDSLFLHNPALSNPWLASKAEAALRRLP